LIYWPDNIVSRDICAQGGNGSSTTAPWTTKMTVFTTDAITFRGRDLYIRSIDELPLEKYWEKPLRWDFRSDANQLISGTSYNLGTVLTGPFTFTSLTVYVAYREISRIEEYNLNGEAAILSGSLV
jgi:hypothetical protein